MADSEARIRAALELQRPFLSANDRSRWMTIRSLVEHGTYEIDEIARRADWDTIDMVQARRPRRRAAPLFQQAAAAGDACVAGEYWLIHRLTGATLRDHPYEIGRVMLVTINILPLVVMYVLLATARRAVRHDRLGPHLRDGRGHARHVPNDVCRRAQ